MSDGAKKQEAIERIKIVDKGINNIDINGGMCCHGPTWPIR